MFLQIVLWSFLGSVVSLIGGVLLALRKQKFTHHQTLLLTSFAAGVILSTALFDLLPESVEMGGEFLAVWVAMGILTLFLLEKSFLWYHHHHEEHKDQVITPWLMNIGDSIHNFIDGVAIAGTFLASPGLGVVTALAVAAHEIPHEMADFGVMLSRGWGKWKTIGVNVASACISLVGSILVYINRGWIEPFVPHLLAFSGGIFLYLACSDLIPEMHHEHKHDMRSVLWQIVCFGVGLAVVYVLINLLGR